MTELIEAIQAESLEPGLLVIDTFARSFAGDENSAQEVGSAITALARIQKALGCTVMVVHHSGKAGGGQGPGAREQRPAWGDGRDDPRPEEQVEEFRPNHF